MSRDMKFIAEMCQNHNGDMDLLETMVVDAAKNGADICKIQTIEAKHLIYWKEFEDFRPYEKEYERLKSLELSVDDEKRFVEICRQNKVEPMTTVFEHRGFKRFNNVGYKLMKISGYSAQKVLPKIKEFNFEHLYISTSSMSYAEIEWLAKHLKLNLPYRNYTLLNCTCVYPTPLEKLNLQNIEFYRKHFGFKNVGLSDHTNPHEDNLLSSKLAIYQGIDVLERHFTILGKDETRDGKVSITPDMLSELKRFSMLSPKEQYEEINELNETQKFNHHYYRNRF
jgi:N,N'-diacetyllegionaminate synthase